MCARAGVFVIPKRALHSQSYNRLEWARAFAHYTTACAFGAFARQSYSGLGFLYVHIDCAEQPKTRIV